MPKPIVPKPIVPEPIVPEPIVPKQGDRVRLTRAVGGIQPDSEGIIEAITPYGLTIQFTHIPPACTLLEPPIIKIGIPADYLASDTKC